MGRNTHEPFDFLKGWIVEDAAPDSVAAKRPHEDFGHETLDPRRYYSPEFMRLEAEHLWPKVWQVAGFASDIPNPGDFFRYDIGRESFVVVRGMDQQIRAFFNVCPHRGNALVHNEFGNVSRFVCSFHGWRFGLDGENTHVTDREMFQPAALCGNLGLKAVRCETVCGLVLINQDANAGPVTEFLGEIVGHLKTYRIEDMRVVRDAVAVWDSNWKTGLDAFNEAYHAFFVHSMGRPVFNDYHTQIDTYPNGMNRRIGMIGAPSPRFAHQGLNDALKYLMHEVGLDATNFDPDDGQVRLAIQQAKRKRAAEKGLDWTRFTDGQLTDDWNYSIFPNFTLNIHVEGLLFQRFRPHPKDPEKTVYDNVVLVTPTDDPASIPAYMGVEPGTDVSGNARAKRRHIPNGAPGLGPVVDEDGVLIPVVQRGLSSRGFSGMRLGEPERCIRQFHAELDKYIYGATKPNGAL